MLGHGGRSPFIAPRVRLGASLRRHPAWRPAFSSHLVVVGHAAEVRVARAQDFSFPSRDQFCLGYFRPTPRNKKAPIGARKRAFGDTFLNATEPNVERDTVLDRFEVPLETAHVSSPPLVQPLSCT
jgi:hypothetical protein